MSGIKISQLPEFAGKLSDAIIAIITGGQNYKMPASGIIPIYIEWEVGDAGFPAAGTNTFTDARLINKKVIVFRNFIPQAQRVISGNSYILKADNAQTITFVGSFSGTEFIQIIALAI